jgi:hypothetical protein
VAEQYDEKKESGNVTWSVYFTYFTIAIGYVGPIVLVMIFAIVQGLLTGADYWISYWFVPSLFPTYMYSKIIIKCVYRIFHQKGKPRTKRMFFTL